METAAQINKRFPKVMNDEMDKFVKLLQENHIPYVLRERDDFIGWYVKIPSLKGWEDETPGTQSISVVCLNISFGGKDGLLEAWAKTEQDVTGYLTADLAYKYVTDHLQGYMHIESEE